MRDATRPLRHRPTLDYARVFFTCKRRATVKNGNNFVLLLRKFLQLANCVFVQITKSNNDFANQNRLKY